MTDVADLPTNPTDAGLPTPRVPRSYRCRCGRPVFFRNSLCHGCGAALGYEALRGQVLALDPGSEENTWHVDGDAQTLYRRCGNFDTIAGCNWLVPASADGRFQPLCQACRLNRTIPDLTQPDHAELWRRIELARRRLVSQLISLGLPVASRVAGDDQDAERGLMFDVLAPLPGAPAVMTGHASGLITLNLDEADDAVRERIRAAMREPYRTLLGHFRHEVGHYYWDRLVDGTPWLDGYRELFGDERDDYAAALQRHYANGPAPDWAQRHVSSYASTHPWEDWAETWAHYLHMVDTHDTALSFGLDARTVAIEIEPFGADVLWRPDDPGAAHFLSFVNEWVALTSVLNELSRSMGQHDFYPFVLPRPVVAKLQFVHLVVQAAAAEPQSAAPAKEPLAATDAEAAVPPEAPAVSAAPAAAASAQRSD
ncbi:zinc-binding metallopeptidase family protein [Methylibium petroleiphilum]|uniref:zinc-binding metallopeptidase family protein n=1 Tax=Methylibium petroleiphilum TaxID=105560 RepID=UPI003D2C28D8